MLVESDLIHIPCTADLIEGGISYACRRMAFSLETTLKSPYDHYRSIVAAAEVELAFRRTLGEKKIPFKVQEAEPFTHPDQYDVVLDGHRCELVSYLISHRAQIKQLRENPALILQAPSLVPLDRFAAENYRPKDVFIFAFLLGLCTRSQGDMQRAQAKGQPHHLVHLLPAEWRRPARWIPMENIAIKSEGEEPISVVLGGLDAERNFITAVLNLEPHTRYNVEQAFFSLAYIHALHKPSARIGLHCPQCGEVYLIRPNEWGNLRVYGMENLFTGWITKDDFRRKAELILPGSHTFQFDRTREKNLQLPSAELNPLDW